MMLIAFKKESQSIFYDLNFNRALIDFKENKVQKSTKKAYDFFLWREGNKSKEDNKI